jgi:diguanylate cyclase (GGDEF)-like protein
MDTTLKKSSTQIVQQSQKSIEKTTYVAINESIKALDEKSKKAIEDKAVSIAENVANFLYQRDSDILFLAQLPLSQKLLQEFYNKKKKAVIIPTQYIYDPKKGWVPKQKQPQPSVLTTTTLQDNAKEFHKVSKQILYTKLIPIYKEITFYLPNGKEVYKVSSIDATCKDISKKTNTYLHAEEYFQAAKKLHAGEIYVSHVIGEYIPSPVIGTFTPKKAKKMGIAFAPERYGYAGKENPVGKKFEGIIRFVTPVYKDNKLKGYITLALDHHHIMDFTDFTNPTAAEKYPIADASIGNYAFMWDNNFTCISHPRDYFIVGYDKNGNKVPGWVDRELAQQYKQSNFKNLNDFLQTIPPFLNQSLDKKPNLEQLKIGQVGLDCKYLNFAPQCQGWSELVSDGGYGSFIIYWSGVWKLTVAAAIPYYTGSNYSNNLGFGFVTIGANVDEFHKAATKTKQQIDTILAKEYKELKEKLYTISSKIYATINQQIQHMTLITFILIIIVVYVAILLANYITNKIQKIIIGTQKLKENNFDYVIEYNSEDEFGKLAKSFNEMANSIKNLKQNLEEKIYTDELTHLQNRIALQEKLKQVEEQTLILIDIDGFKNINDFYGSEIGNYILQKFAKILKDFSTQHSFFTYRVGSDDFVLLATKVLTNQEVKDAVHQLKTFAQQHPIVLQDIGESVALSFTCGVSNIISNSLEKADIALNIAKRNKSLFAIYDPHDISMNRHTEFIYWKEKITYAIEHNRIVPYFQPIVNVHNPKEKKYEVLMRLLDEDKIITPNIFLDISKETRQYTELTKIMISKAFETLNNTQNTIFSVNISMIDIADDAILEFIYNKLKIHDVGKRVIFEILETEDITDVNRLLDFTNTIRSYGAKLAIDDFGSGYSNFTHFMMIKPDFLKIDGSLIKNIKQNSVEYHIVKAITKFAKSLKIKTVAEFVSTKEIYETLLTLDIDYMQGYYFSEPKESL